MLASTDCRATQWRAEEGREDAEIERAGHQGHKPDNGEYDTEYRIVGAKRHRKPYPNQDKACDHPNDAASWAGHECRESH
jgi:hypothetical protein